MSLQSLKVSEAIQCKHIEQNISVYINRMNHKKFKQSKRRRFPSRVLILLKAIIGFVTIGMIIAGCGSGNNEVASDPPPPPTAPANLTAVNVASQTVRLNWVTSPTATGYNIYMTEAQKNTYMLEGSTDLSYYEQKNLNNGTTYLFIVRAVAASGESGPSNVAEASPGPPPPPTAPTNLTAVNVASQTVRLNWVASSTATGYNVYMTDVQKNTSTLVGSTTSSYYDQKSLKNSTAYSFIVTALNEGGESGFSNNAVATPDIVIRNPYQTKSRIYKGATHLHTTNSDGKRTPDEVAAAYKNGGYDFIVITDHDLLTTFVNDPGILTIKGVEETATEGHLVTVNINGNNNSQQAQVIIDEAVGAGGLAILCHPNYIESYYYWNYTFDELDKLGGYTGIEIYNHVVQIETGKGNAEEKWDYILSSGRMVFGVASDDMHDFNSNMGFMGGWNKVFADSLAVQDIIESMKTGNFFATTGPDLAVSVSAKTLSVTTDAPATIEFIVKGGQVKEMQSKAKSAAYHIVGDEMYVRVRVTRDSDGKKAWSNPVFVQ